jgi:hypothetical protein
MGFWRSFVSVQSRTVGEKLGGEFELMRKRGKLQTKRRRESKAALKKSLKQYSAAAGAALALGGTSLDTTPAEADPVFVPANIVLSAPYAYATLDINGDGSTDMSAIVLSEGGFAAQFAYAYGYFAATPVVVTTTPGETFTYPFLKRLASSVLVNTTALYPYPVTSAGAIGLRTPYGLFGQFAGQRGLVGAAIDFGSGDLHFAFLDISASSNLDQLTIHGWGYETEPSTPIHARLIPEPDALALLAMGAAGVLAWRLRRKQRAEEVGETE